MPRGKRSTPKDLDSLIKQLTEQRASELQQTNEQRHAAALTAEILSIIFEYACIDSATSLLFPVTKYDSEFLSDQQNKGCRYVPLVLSAVCARWRRVAWSTPTLWTSISLQLVPDFFFIRVTTSVLRLYMQNSGSFPISVELDFRKCSGITVNSSDQTALEHFREMVIQQNPSKFKAFRIISPPTVQWLPQPDSNFSALEDFSLGSQGPVHVEVYNKMLQNITTLHRLHLQGVHTLRSETQLLWPNITVLHLYQVSKHVCVSLLVKCRNLISCQCYGAFALHSYADPREPVTLSELEDFGWDCVYLPFKSLRLPSLEKLRLYDLTRDHALTQAEFLPNISSTLRVLELGRLDSQMHWRRPYKTEEFFKELLQMLVNVTKLTLSASCIGTLSCMLSSLTPSVGRGDVTLPNLQILQCRDLRRDLHDDKKQCICDSRRLSKMLRMRRGQGWNGPLRFEVFGECGIRWRKDARKEIVAMVAKGLELQIVEDARPVRWLHV